MKNLIFIILSCLTITSYSQTSLQTLGNTTNYVKVKGQFGADSVLILPRYADTTSANKYSNFTDTCGKLIFTYSTGDVWKRVCSPNKWVAFGTVTAILGTANQIIATTLNGVTTLSLPQNIATNSYPKFSSDTLSAITIGSPTDSVMTVDALGVPHKRNVTSIGKQGDSLIVAGTVSSTPQIGDVVGTNITAGNFIQQEFFKSQPPTAGLIGGGNYELHSAGTFAPATTWTAGRQAATQNISTVNVNGVNQTFTNPTQPGSTSGITTPAVTITWNSNTTITNTVTTTDSKTASQSTSFNFLPNRYWGVSNGTPIGTDLINSVGGGQELSNSIAKGAFVITVSSSTKNVFYAYPQSEGALSSIIISGLESIGAFTLSTLPFTNASGYTQVYNIYKSNNTFSSTTVSFNSVN